MNPVSNRLKAIAVTAAFFALSGLALLGVIWGLSALPFTVPGGLALTAYRPHDTVSILSDLRLPVALTAAFLVATAIVLVFSSAYLDKMIAIFADVLLMLMAALAGFVAGYWVLLRLAGDATGGAHAHNYHISFCKVLRHRHPSLADRGVDSLSSLYRCHDRRLIDGLALI